ncbi:MAG: hypothetical protein BAJALOKI1v1_140025 [Promethearchaeota archaeon]|nr:MAG: hypothetical protein BAJALOKI1v1_140025 [Candidatus Lokiarchaeota archaeon]
MSEINITLDDAKNLIGYIRENIAYFLKTGKRLPIPEQLKQRFRNKCGAFVTLNKTNVSGNPLRGCIGYIEPKYELCEVIHRVSVSAACEDPRFPSVRLEELDNIIIEISILTPPKLIEVNEPQEYFHQIKIGRDGLIVERGMRRGLLLPQVPIEHERNWDAKTFLEQTCRKAWLSQDAWKEEDIKVYKFSAILFEETSPGGQVERKYLTEQ